MKRATLILLILAVALPAGVSGRLKLQQARRGLAGAEELAASADERLAAAHAENVRLREELAAEQSRHARVLGDIGQANREMAKVDPEARWAVPPPALPDWDEESPYVWLRKEMIPQLRVSMFTDEGWLRPEAAYVLMIEQGKYREMNAALQKCLSDYRALEASRAERIEEHLSGIAGSGPKVTVRVPVMREEGERSREEFEAALRGALGEQRARLVMQTDAGWIDEQFSQFSAAPKTISLIRHPHGGFNVSIQSGGSFTSLSLDASHREMIYEYIPRHLAEWFRGVLEEQQE